MIPVNANGTAFASSLERGIDRKKRAAASAVETCGAMSHRISAILLLLVFPLFESVAQERIGRSARIDCAEGACSSSEQIIRGQAEIQSIPDAERNVLAQLAREASAEESKDALLEQLRLGNGDVTLSFELSERPFDFGRFRSGDESRQDLIEERRLQVEESQAHFAQAVERLGGAVLHRSWAVNKVIARIPRAAVPELLSSPSVFAASLSKGTTEFLTNGAQRRIYSKVNFPYVFGEHDAETGNGTVPGEPVLIAVIDQGDLNTTHVGWRDGVSGSQLRVLAGR